MAVVVRQVVVLSREPSGDMAGELVSRFQRRWCLAYLGKIQEPRVCAIVCATFLSVC